MSSSRWRFGGLSLRSKILLMIVPVSLLSVALMAIVGYRVASDGLTQQAYAQVTAIRASKKAQIETYFLTLRGTFAAFSDDLGVASAAQALIESFGQLGRQPLGAERSNALASFYRDDVVAKLNKIPGFDDLSADQLMPRSSKAAEAQSLFIVENPNSAGDRDKLIDSPANNPYTLAHYTYHVWLRGLVDRLKFDDIYIVSDRGDVVYSSEKQPDFATNLIDGPYATSNLARLFRDITEQRRKGLVKLVDYEFYAPSGGAPTMFIGTPIYVGARFVGVLIGQLSVDGINRTLNGDRSWQADGFGRTGFAYVTGPGRRLHNDHRIFVERPDEFLTIAAGQGYRPAEIDAIRRVGTPVLRYLMNTEGIRRALLGETGTVEAPNSLGHVSIQAYTPIDLPDLKWVLNANIERSEILAPLDMLERTGLAVAGILTLFCTVFAMWTAARFVRPITTLIAGTEAIKAGKSDVRIDRVGSDEFGKLADSFNTMASAIRDRDAIIEGKNTAYAALLNRIFPEVVADRLRAGDEKIVDTSPNVSLIYTSVTGFLEAIEGMDSGGSAKLLNEIIDRIDAVAEQYGVEPVKTIGEHYFAACGLTVPRLDHAARAVEFADGVAREMRLVATEHGAALAMRAAIASGELHAGLVGNSRFVYDVWGKPLNLVRRLIQSAEPNEIRITDAVYRQLGPDSGFDERPPTPSILLGEITSFGRPAASGPAGSPRSDASAGRDARRDAA